MVSIYQRSYYWYDYYSIIVMWQFFQWAWNLSWGDGIALMIWLFVFWYGKKWIDQKFGTDSFSKRQARQLKQIVKEAIEETK